MAGYSAALPGRAAVGGRSPRNAMVEIEAVMFYPEASIR